MADTDRGSGPETVSLGRFDPLELPIILEALRARGIFAMTKSPLDKAENEQYAVMAQSREVLLVDRDREQEARRVIATEVRDEIEQMRSNLDADPVAEFDAAGLAPLGWVEPEVARELLALLADAEIPAQTEYPLDAPPPPYARADGRVRVHVEAVNLEAAAEILDVDVREALAARGVAPAEPLLGEDE